MELSLMLLLLILLEILLLLVAIIFTTAFVIEGIFLLTSRQLGSPYVPTQRKFFEDIRQALSLKQGGTLFELGSGDGSFLLFCAKKEPQANYFGIERNPLLFAYAQMRKHFAGNPKNITFIFGNFFKADLSNASHIYAYLLPEVMELLLPKLEKRSNGLRVVSLGFPFAKRQTAEILELSKRNRFHHQHLLYIYEL